MAKAIGSKVALPIAKTVLDSTVAVVSCGIDNVEFISLSSRSKLSITGLVKGRETQDIELANPQLLSMLKKSMRDNYPDLCKDSELIVI